MLLPETGVFVCSIFYLGMIISIFTAVYLIDILSMKKTKIEEENAVLKQALSAAKKENEKLFQQLEKSKIKTVQLSAELKKNAVRTVALTKEQEQLLLNLSKGMGIPNLLSD